ncbi:MAG: hypothetical protein AAFR38_11535 [Planctomycetota bacterium]
MRRSTAQGVAVAVCALASVSAGAAAGSMPQVFYVDFDTIIDAEPGTPGLPDPAFIYDYSPDQRAFILGYLNERYESYGMMFVEGTKPAPGAGSNVTLNSGSGAGAEQIDFRNLDGGDDADVNILSIFEEFLGVTTYTDADVVIGTANVVGHEAEHLMGMRHHDKAGPVGLGIGGGLFPGDFTPTYPGPVGGFDSGKTTTSLHAGGVLTFSNLTKPKVIPERLIPRLIVAGDPGFTITEAGGNNMFPTAQAIDPAPFGAPYPLRPSLGPDVIDGRALVVAGALDIPGIGGGFVSDYYEFTGTAGEPWTIEAMSYILPDPDSDGERYFDNADVAIILLAGSDAPMGVAPGSVIPYYSDPFGAVNDDDDDADQVPSSKPFDSYAGATLLDVVLPYTGSYVIEVIAAAPFIGTGKDGSDGGSYELFMYTVKPTTLPRCSGADIIPDFAHTSDDVVAFLELTEIGEQFIGDPAFPDIAADVNIDGLLNIFDMIDFLREFDLGCP